MKLDEIDQFILESIPLHPYDVVAVVSKHFNKGKTTVRYRLKKLIAAGYVDQVGSRNEVVYTLINDAKKDSAKEAHFSYKVGELSEDEVWKRDIRPTLGALAKNIIDICNYGFTEMFNNVIDHSRSSIVTVEVELTDTSLQILILDKGIGVFKNIAEYFKIADLRDAVVKLHQGKVTTDKTKHTGQGIFFTSRAFDKFILTANGFAYYKDNSTNDDWYFQRKEEDRVGTGVCLIIDLNSTRILKSVFDAYSNPEDLAFDSSHIRIQLSLYEEDDYVSRSQAKRLLAGLGNFKTIILDFKNIKFVGQAFVDEVFGVFGLEHSQITFDVTNVNDDVEYMIRRALRDRNFPISRIRMREER